MKKAEKKNSTKTEGTEKKAYPLRQIYFYLTEGCNLACRHCWIAPKYQTSDRLYPELDFELFRSIVQQAKTLGLSGVKLTGGEPTLHSRIHEILDFIRTEDILMTMETNGMLCTPELAREMKACRKPSVSVSLDSSEAETHERIRGVAGSFQAAVDGIRNLSQAGLKPQIIMTLMRQNRDHIKPLITLAESLGAGSVKFNIMQPTARGEKLHFSGENLTIEELIDLGKLVENDLSATTPLQLSFHHPAAFRPLGKMFGEDGSGCNVCGILGILGVLSDGSYALCGIGETVPELIFGHAGSERLEKVWNDNPVLQDIREGLPNRLEGVCGDCLMKGRCLGGCIAQNYYRSKNLWAPFWFCEDARKAGLFPETRVPPELLQKTGSK